MVQRRLARVRERREVAEEAEEVTRDEEGERGEITAGLSNLNMETSATEEEAAVGLAEAFGMEVEEVELREGEEGVEGLNGHWKPLSSSLRKKSQAA